MIPAIQPAAPRPFFPFREGTLLVCLFLLAGFPAAAERVVFTDSRVLEVLEVIQDGEWMVLRLPSGGETSVRAASVLEIRASIPPEPEPPPVLLPPSRTGAWRRQAGELAIHVRSAAKKNQIEPELIVAVGMVESRMNPRAVSPKGAQGVMQLMPGTARQLSVQDPFDPRENIHGGAKWLRRLLDRFKGDLDLALAAYNAGEEAVNRHRGIPPFAETRAYVRLVRQALEKLRPALPPAA